MHPIRTRTIHPLLPVAAALLAAAQPAAAHAQPPRAQPAVAAEASLVLTPCRVPGLAEEVRCGRYEVYEDRAAGRGRRIPLHVVVLPARAPDPAPDPVFFLAGGPGEAATGAARMLADGWMRQERDVVLVDQRGSGGSNPLRCRPEASGDTPQGWLDGVFHVNRFRRCRNELARRADLRLYTTPMAVDDLDAVRRALGYGPINLIGGSYGTRTALVYLRRHPESVRSAILNGAAPPALTVPLPYARDAQRALDLLIEECARDAACGAAFPELRREYDVVIERLDRRPVRVAVRDPRTGEPAHVRLSRPAFSEAVRAMTYGVASARALPMLIHRAYGGDFSVFAEVGVTATRGMLEALDMGLMLSITCAEDVPRIDPADIPRFTDGTGPGDVRVRGQMAVCGMWPRGEVGPDYADPVRAAVPVLVLSGTMDPVTPPEWGEEVVRYLPNALHVVAPGAHIVRGPCIDLIQRRFLAAASVEGLDTGCVDQIVLPPFLAPAGG
jgi:pimeloyl-ACP methyl ester carboxylesterase